MYSSLGGADQRWLKDGGWWLAQVLNAGPSKQIVSEPLSAFEVAFLLLVVFFRVLCFLIVEVVAHMKFHYRQREMSIHDVLGWSRCRQLAAGLQQFVGRAMPGYSTTLSTGWTCHGVGFQHSRISVRCSRRGFSDSIYLLMHLCVQSNSFRQEISKVNTFVPRAYIILHAVTVHMVRVLR